MTADHVRRLAREQGLVIALTEMHDALGGRTVPCGPTGCCVLPPAVLREADRVWAGGSTIVLEPARIEQLRPVATGAGDLVAVRYRAAPGAGGGTPAPWAGWLLDLAGLRLGLSQALLDATVTHLGERRAGDTSLLLQQLVKGALADAVTEQLEIRLRLTDPPAGLLPDLHRQITTTDRMLLRLLGASGFTTAGPGLDTDASELVADAWTATFTAPEADLEASR